MKLFRTLFVAGLVQVAALSAAHAQSGLDQIKSAGVLVRHRGHLRPFTFHEASGQLVGFDVDIGRAIAQRLGVKAEFVEGKWDGLIAGLDAKRYDAVINQVGITDARKAKYDFSDPYISSAAVLIVRDDNTTIKSFEDLKGRKSANTLTSNFGKLAQRHGADLVAVQGFNESIDLLTSGRVEATVNDNLSYLDFKKQKPNAKVKIAATDKAAEFSSSGVLLRKGNPELVAAINKALADIKADGTYKTISVSLLRHRRVGAVSRGSAHDATHLVAGRPARRAAGADQWLGGGLGAADGGLVLAAARRPGVPLTLASFALGLALAFVVALIRLFGPAPLVAVRAMSGWCAAPLLVQLFVIFYGLPSAGIVLDPLPAALIGFTLNVGAYNSEVIRAAIESITRASGKPRTH